MKTLEEARHEFRQTATEFWARLRDKDSRSANKQTDRGDALVAEWSAAGQIDELLLPLLDDANTEVRYAAAAHLLTLGHAERAVPVLEELARNPKGLLAPTAGLLLAKWRREN